MNETYSIQDQIAESSAIDTGSPEIIIVSFWQNSTFYGSVCILNEYFIDGVDILSSHVCDAFNTIFNLGCFPINGPNVL